MVRSLADQRRSVAGALVAASLVCAAPAVAQRLGNPGAADAQQARQLVQQGRCEAALDYFDRAIRRMQGDATLRRDRGMCHDQLGNPKPALEDYRAYLSMEPNATDAFVIRQRLEELEKVHQAPVRRGVDHDRDGREEPVETVEDLEDPFAIEEGGKAPAEEKDEAVVRVPARGWLLGPYLGYRWWKVFDDRLRDPEPTLSLGAVGGYAYRRGAEIQLRLAFLRTKGTGGFGGAKGIGIGADHFWKIGLNRTRTLELMIGVGGAYERQETNNLGVVTNFFFGRFQPLVRWAFVPAVALQAGPELGVGAAKVDAAVGGAAGGMGSTTEGLLYYGISAAVVWRIGTSAKGDRHEAVDPDEPLGEDDLWDD